MFYTTKLPPSGFLPDSFRCDARTGQTSTMLATTSTSGGICSSFVMIARRRFERRNIIQSRCSALLGQLMMNSVIDKGSKQSDTADATFWTHLLSSRKSKIGYSTNLFVYPLRKYSAYGSARTWDPQRWQLLTLGYQQQQPRTQPQKFTRSITV